MKLNKKNLDSKHEEVEENFDNTVPKKFDAVPHLVAEQAC